MGGERSTHTGHDRGEANPANNPVREGGLANTQEGTSGQGVLTPPDAAAHAGEEDAQVREGEGNTGAQSAAEGAPSGEGTTEGSERAAQATPGETSGGAGGATRAGWAWPIADKGGKGTKRRRGTHVAALERQLVKDRLEECGQDAWQQARQHARELAEREGRPLAGAPRICQYCLRHGHTTEHCPMREKDDLRTKVASRKARLQREAKQARREAAQRERERRAEAMETPQAQEAHTAESPAQGRDNHMEGGTMEAGANDSGAHARRMAGGGLDRGRPSTQGTTHAHTTTATARDALQGGNGTESSEEEAGAWWAEPGRTKRPVVAWPRFIGAPAQEGGRVRRQVADIELRIQADMEAAGLGQAPGGHARAATEGEIVTRATKTRARTPTNAEGGASGEGGQEATGAEGPTEGSGHSPDSSPGGVERAEGQGEMTLSPGKSREGEDQATAKASLGDTNPTSAEGRDGATGKEAENIDESMEEASKKSVSLTGGETHTTDTLERCESPTHNGTTTDKNLGGSNPTPTVDLGNADPTAKGGQEAPGLRPTQMIMSAKVIMIMSAKVIMIKSAKMITIYMTSAVQQGAGTATAPHLSGAKGAHTPGLRGTTSA